MTVFQNVYDDLRDKLIAKGIPAEEIAYIHDANTEAKKKELFGKVRSGQIRVLLGSTQYRVQKPLVKGQLAPVVGNEQHIVHGAVHFLVAYLFSPFRQSCHHLLLQLGGFQGCAENVFEIWQNTADQRSTQMVFCDLSTPGKGRPIEMAQNEQGTFEMTVFQNVYDDLRDKLIAKGIPAEEGVLGDVSVNVHLVILILLPDDAALPLL